jgi:hypothetical protein
LTKYKPVAFLRQRAFEAVLKIPHRDTPQRNNDSLTHQPKACIPSPAQRYKGILVENPFLWKAFQSIF